MSSNAVHIVTHDEGWAVKPEGETSPRSTHATQKDAIEAAFEVGSDEDRVVVHRKDGRIREVRTITEDNSSSESQSSNSTQTSAGRNTTMSTVESLSVGSRIKWSCVFAGLVISIVLSITLSMVGAALSITLANWLSGDWVNIFAGVWVFMSILASLFAGGMIVSRMTVGEEGYLEPSVYGAVLWAAFFVAMPLIPVASMDLGFGKLQSTDVLSVKMSVEERQQVGINAEQYQALQDMMDGKVSPYQKYAGSVTDIAWLSFVLIILSLGAAICGSLVGTAADDRVVKVKTA